MSQSATYCSISDFRAAWRLLLALGLVTVGLVATSDVGAQQTAETPPQTAETAVTEQLQQQLADFQQRVAEIYQQDPERATRMIRDLGNAARLLRSRPSATDPLASSTVTPRFELAQREIEHLHQLKSSEIAAQFATQLAKLQTAYQTQDDRQLPASQVPEVHRIQLSRGTTLPSEFRSPENRLSTSYAKIKLQYTRAPIILVLESSDPMLWHIEVAEGVEVFAVIVESLRTQRVVGLSSPLLLDVQTAMAQGLLDYRATGTQSRGELLAGAPAVTSRSYPQYVQPIVVGSSNAAWMDAMITYHSDQLIQLCRIHRRDREAAMLADLRYHASFPQRLDGTRIQSCRAEFNVRGPLAPTLEPHADPTIRRQLQIRDDGQLVTFGINTVGALVTSTKSPSGSPTTARVPLDHQVFNASTRIGSLCYDAKRHRLICSTSGSPGLVAALAIKTGQWQELGRFTRPILAVTYAPTADQLHAIAANFAPGTPSQDWGSAQFIRLSADGTVLSSLPVSRPLLDLPSSTNAASLISRFFNQPFELVHQGEYVVLNGQQFSEGSRSSPLGSPYHYLIDVETGRMLFDGPLAVNSGLARPTTRRPAQPSFSLLNEVVTQMTQVGCFRAPPQSMDDDDLDANAVIRGILRGQELPRETARNFFVGTMVPQSPARIRLSDRNGPINLILASNQKTQWEVDVPSGVDLQQVVLDSPATSTVRVSREDVPITSHIGTKSFRCLSNNRHLQPERLRAFVRQKTGLRPSMIRILSSRLAEHETIHLGPENGALRLKLAADLLTQRQQQSTRREFEAIATEIQSKNFYAVYRGHLPGSPVEKNTPSVFWNAFTIAGPKIGHSAPVYRSTAFNAEDPASGVLYSADLYRLHITRPGFGKAEMVDVRRIAKGMGRITGLYFDPDQRQLLVDTQTGLWSYDPVTKDVEIRIRKSTPRTIATTYSPVLESWFGLQQERRQTREVTRIRKYNRHFVMVHEVELTHALSRLTRSLSSGYPPQLIVLGDYLAIIDYQQQNKIKTVNGRRVVSRHFLGELVLVESDTGHVVYEGRLTPHVEYQRLSTEQLAQLWKQLMLTNDEDAETVMWQLASGGESALKFLREQYHEPPPIAAFDLDEAIAKLDDNRFSIRELAYRRLKEAGSQLTPELRQLHQREGLSAEVRERLGALLRIWSAGIPQSPQQLQEIRGIEAIYRMGLDTGRSFLESLRTDKFEAHIREQAKRSLEDGGALRMGFRNPAVELQNNLFVPRDDG